MYLPAYKPELVLDFLQSSVDMFALMEKYDSPLHLLFPQILNEQLGYLKRFSRDGVVSFYVAHKPVHSLTLLKEVEKSGFSIDVSSMGELHNALSAGFTPQRIECTGPKSLKFIFECVNLGCLISVDSIGELEYICSLNSNARVLLRLSNPLVAKRELITRRSKFGIDRLLLEDIYKLLLDNPRVKFLGYHFHQDGHDASLKSGIIEYFLSEIHHARNLGLMPHIINMGGGFGSELFADKNDWQRYVTKVAKHLIEGKNDLSWSYSHLGLTLSASGVIENRVLAESPINSNRLPVSLSSIYTSETSSDIELIDLLFECNIHLCFEPGHAIFHNSGVTIMRVQDVKEIQSQKALICNGNMFTLSSRMFMPIADPILISQSMKEDVSESNQENSYFILGNLCREDDCIMDRVVHFPREVQRGDLLVFLNTSSYSQTYEATYSQMQNMAKTLIVSKQKTEWCVMEENKDDI